MTSVKPRRKRKPNPRTEIGPYYKILGFMSTMALIILIALHESQGRPWEWVHVAIGVLLLLLILCFVRPENFDAAFRWIVKAIPWTKYEGRK
jgi:cell division protein FtsW (lipid II flippase)